MRRPAPFLASALALSLALSLASCGGGGGDSTAPPTAGPPTAVSVTFPAQTLTLGDSARATATVRDARGAVLGSAAVTWRSSAPNVLAVNAATGMTKALALDTASVIATVSSATGVTGAATVRVRPPTTALVTMLPNAFSPFSLVLAVGGAVTYDFGGGIDHNVTFERKTGAPADVPTQRAGRVARTFATAGTFPYECRVHPGMIGEIVVVP
jgi:plastocyanin